MKIVESLKKIADSRPMPWYSSECIGLEQALAKPSRDNYASNLDKFMGDAKVSNAELARRVGVTRVAVGRWRDGTSEPSYEDKDKIAKALGRAVADFFRDPTDSRTTGMDADTALDIIIEIVKSSKRTPK